MTDVIIVCFTWKSVSLKEITTVNICTWEIRYKTELITDKHEILNNQPVHGRKSTNERDKKQQKVLN